MIRDYEDCCRLCLAKDGQMLLSIFSEDEIEKMIAPKILYCYSLFVYPQDPFSKLLCLRCLYQLEETWNFKQKCSLNNALLNETLAKDLSVKHSDQFLSSVEGVIRSANMYTLVTCKTPEEVALIYQRYEAFINFSCQVENVEIIDIASDEEDSKLETKRLILQRSGNTRPPHEVHYANHQLSLRYPNSASRASRRSVSSERSDDAHSNFSDRTSSTRTTTENSNVDGNENLLLGSNEKSFYSNRLSRERKQLLGSTNLTLDTEKQPKTRGRKSNSSLNAISEDKSILSNSSFKNCTSIEKSKPSLRGQRPLHKKKINANLRNENLKPERRPSSRCCENDSNLPPHDRSLASKDASMKKKDNVPGIAGKRRKHSGQVCNVNGSSESAYFSTDCDEDNISLSEFIPPSKRWKGDSENLPSEKTAIKRYSCKYCRKTFRLKIDKKQHLKSCSEKKMINCKHCLKRMYREDELCIHSLCHLRLNIIKLPKNRHLCEFCNRYFYPKNALKKHKKSHILVACSESARRSPELAENSKANKDSETDSSDNDSAEDQSPVSRTLSSSRVLGQNLDDSSRRDFRSRRQRNKVDLPLVQINFAKKQPISQGLNMETNKEYVNNVCKYCFDTFKDAAELWKHMQICHKYVNVSSSTTEDVGDSTSVYPCTDENCKKKFTSLKELIFHSQTHVSLKCNHCSFSTFKFFTFLNHTVNCPLSNQKSKFIRCCNKKFHKRYNFYVHKMFECQLNKTPLNISFSSETSVNVKCGVCNKKVASSSEQLLLHLIHHARSNFNSDCPQQEGNVSDSDQAVFMKTFELCPKEISKENRIVSFECSECKDSFLSLQAFQDHKKKCFILSCAKCRLTFSNNYDFIVHRCVQRCKLCLSHLENNQHVCSVRKVILAGPKNRFKCSICSAVLPNLLACRKHIFKHFPCSSSEWKENVPCQICKQTFSNLLTLDIHHHLQHSSSKKPVSLSRSKDPNQKDQKEYIVAELSQKSLFRNELIDSQRSKDISVSEKINNSESSQVDACDNSSPAKINELAETCQIDTCDNSPPEKINESETSQIDACDNSPPENINESKISQIDACDNSPPEEINESRIRQTDVCNNSTPNDTSTTAQSSVSSKTVASVIDHCPVSSFNDL